LILVFGLRTRVMLM